MRMTRRPLKRFTKEMQKNLLRNGWQKVDNEPKQRGNPHHFYRVKDDTVPRRRRWICWNRAWNEWFVETFEWMNSR